MLTFLESGAAIDTLTLHTKNLMKKHSYLLKQNLDQYLKAKFATYSRHSLTLIDAKVAFYWAILMKSMKNVKDLCKYEKT